MRRLDTPQELHERLCRRLAVVVDDRFPIHIQLCAVRAIQRQDLGDRDPLKHRDPMDLLSAQRDPWETRTVYDRTARKLVKRQLNRPPRSISDVW